MTDAEKMIRKARLNIIHKYRYFASVALMPIIPDSYVTKTMGTDSKYLYFNEMWVSKLKYEEVYSVTLHEILHCVFMHILRRKDRKKLAFQYAADYAINNFIINYMHLKLPKPHLYDEKYNNMSTEEIYEDLVKPIPHNDFTRSVANKESNDIPEEYPTDSMFDPDEQDTNDQGQNDQGQNEQDTDDQDQDYQDTDDQDQDAMTSKAETLAKLVTLKGELLDPPDENIKNQELTKKNIRQALGEEPGRITDRLLSIVDKHKKVERVQWYHLIQNYIRNLVSGDYGFHSPNVRYVYSGFYLPSFRVKRIRKLSLVIDVSGSIVSREDMLNDFFEHIRNIAEDVYINDIEILTCNTKIVNSFTINSHELMFHSFDITGGGGTSFYPPLDYYDSHDSDNESPDLMIYFTDLEGDFRKEPPDYPIIWVVIESQEYPGTFGSAPYGVEIRYEP